MLTPDTVFDIGKVTNQLTATAVLLLADEGELRLDDPVSAYVDGLPAWADDVTVTNLIHHTSGLPDYVDLLTDQGFEPQDPTTQAQASRHSGPLLNCSSRQDRCSDTPTRTTCSWRKSCGPRRVDAAAGSGRAGVRATRA
jgi:CubicO group peptidase (beta-lactamase class C family)